MFPHLDYSRAERSLRAILDVSESALTGKVRLTDELIFSREQHLYNWRSVLGLIWSHAHEGLGEDIPTPPPVPPHPPDACQGFRPCPDCPLIPQDDAEDEQKGCE